MDETDKDMRLHFEEIVNNNLKMIQNYTRETRSMVNKLEEQIRKFDGLVREKDEKIDQLHKQIIALQVKLYQGGS